MKRYFYIMMSIAVLGFAACDSEDNILLNNNDNENFTFVASMQDSPSLTRTTATDNGDGTVSFLWSNSDDNQKARFYWVYSSSGTATYRKGGFMPTPSIDKKTATFTIDKTPITDSYVYGCTTINGNISNTARIDAADLATADKLYVYVQTNNHICTKDELGTYNPMFGVLQNNSKDIPNTMLFKNVCALIKFTVTLPSSTTITRVDLRKGESGTITYKKTLQITGSTKTFDFIDDETSGYTTAEGSVTRNSLTWPTEEIAEKHVLTFYAVVIPQDFDKMWLKLTDASGTYTKSTTFTPAKSLAAGKMYTVNLTFAAKD